MSNMGFLPELREFLRTNRFIYTVRGYDMSRTQVWVNDVGWCDRIPLGCIKSLKDLEPYVTDSGFDSLSSWVKKIEHFIKRGDPAWLYRIEV